MILVCGTCVYLTTWSVFPPVFAWTLVFPAWFFCLAAAKHLTEADLPLVPGMAGAVVLILVLLFLSAAYLGPLAMMFLAIPCLVVTLSGFASGRYTPEQRRSVRILSVIGLIALTGTGILASVSAARMAPADRLVRVGYLPVVHRELERIRQDHPDPVSVYREFLGRVDSPVALRRLTDYLLAYPEPEAAAPLLRELMGRLKAKGMGAEVEKVERALKEGARTGPGPRARMSDPLTAGGVAVFRRSPLPG
jgi:hypothetical protein